MSVHFVGYRHDGTTVTADFLPGTNFQTFYFDQSFTNLDRVEIPTFGWSLDNLVVSAPAPYPTFTGNHIVAWGDNSYGQTNVPVGATNVQAIAAGYGFSLALKTNGTVIEWGGMAVPSGLSNVVAIAAGYRQGIALKSDGTLFAWGTGPLTNVPAGLTNVVAISCGQYHNLALKNDGTIHAWGGDDPGLTNIPADLQNVVAIAAGTGSSFAIRQDGSTWLSGPYTNQFNTFSSNVVAAAISSGVQGIAVRGDGTGYGWGFPNGTNVLVVSNVTAVASVSPITASSASGAVWALLRNGTLTGLASGANLASYFGQTNVWMNLTSVVAIASGYTHHLAIVGDGLPKAIEPMTSAGISNGQFIVVQPTSLGRSYRLEYRNSLVEDWQILPPVPGNGSTQTLADPCPLLSQRFYRVRVGQ
jgi:hypothetical protein